MAEITIFTAPKPFSDPHINIIQRNAIRSWKSLGPRVDVLMIGDEEGMEDAASELDVVHLRDVTKNELGTPQVNAIFRLARSASSADYLIYANADIIFLPDILDVLDRVRELEEIFLLVGRRWDLDITRPIDFSGSWQGDLERQRAAEGVLSSQTAMDYFIYPRTIFQEIPPFAIGRAGWDNWMIYHARQKGWPVIDLTASNRVIHQNHDYRHLPGGMIHYDLEESRQNVDLAGGMQTTYDLLDVRLVFVNGKIRRKAFDLPSLLRSLERRVIPDVQEGWRWSLTRVLRKTRKRIEKNRRRNG
jgi:hypothetical protein